MKKIFLLLMVVVILTTSSFAVTFSDLPEGHWAKGCVEEMVNAGIISGYTDGTFKPSAELSKIHSLLLLARIAGIRENTAEASKYASTYATTLSKYSTQYKSDIAYLLGRGILKENELDDFIADDKINQGLTREEMAILVTKVLGKENEATSKSLIVLSFKDASTISAKAKPYVYFVNSNGYMNGVDNDNFAPKMILTRAQAASVFQRIYKLVDNKTNNSTSSTPTTSPTTPAATSFVTGTISKIDTSGKTVTIKDGNGNSKKYTYNTNTEFYVNSQKKTSAAMAKDAKVTATLTKDGYITVMNISSGANVETSTLTGTISSANTTKKTVTIKKSSKTYTYDYDTATKFTLDGSTSTATKSLIKNREITVTIEDDKYISVAKVSTATESIIGIITDYDDDEGYIVIEDDDDEKYILMDEEIDEYTDDDEDFTFDEKTKFYYNGSSKNYDDIFDYIYDDDYYVEITLNDKYYITKFRIASSKSKLGSDDDEDEEEESDEITAIITSYDDDEGYITIKDDDKNKYILMDKEIDEYEDEDEDFYFDEDTKFYYNGSSKDYDDILDYIYDKDYYVKITIDDDDYIEEFRVASSKSKLGSSSSSSSNTPGSYTFGYVAELKKDKITIEDKNGDEYTFNIGSDCVIIESDSDDPETDLEYYDDYYDDMLEESSEVMIFSYKKSSKYYTSLIILLD